MYRFVEDDGSELVLTEERQRVEAVRLHRQVRVLLEQAVADDVYYCNRWIDWFGQERDISLAPLPASRQFARWRTMQAPPHDRHLRLCLLWYLDKFPPLNT